MRVVEWIDDPKGAVIELAGRQYRVYGRGEKAEGITVFSLFRRSKLAILIERRMDPDGLIASAVRRVYLEALALRLALPHDRGTSASP